MTMTLDDVTRHWGACEPKLLSDGRVAFIHQLIYTCAICVGKLTDVAHGYDDRWCYHDAESARRALIAWDGTGEPAGWHRHPFTGRRRPEGDATREYVSL